MQEKYKVLMNLTQSQGTCIRNLKFNHLKEKEVLSTSTRNLKFQVDELKKSEEKLTQDNTQLLLHMGDLKKGHEKLTSRRDELKIQIAELLKSEEKNKQKLKGILDILSE